MQKFQRHIPWIFILLLILFFAFFFSPEPTDTGEEKEVVFEKDVKVELEEQKGIDEALQDTVLPVVKEPRDEVREAIDTVPTVLEKQVEMVVEK